MSTLRANVVQLGFDADPSRNLTIRTNQDGSFTVARGNAGATTQDILSIGADGSVNLPAQPFWFGRLQGTGAGPFSSYSPTLTVIDSSGITRPTATTLKVPVAGRYFVHAQQLVLPTGSSVYLHLRKNGVVQGYGYLTGGSPQRDMVVSGILNLTPSDSIDFFYLNGVQEAWGGDHSSVCVMKVT